MHQTILALGLAALHCVATPCTTGAPKCASESAGNQMTILGLATGKPTLGYDFQDQPVIAGGKVRAAGPTIELMQRLDLLPVVDGGETGAVIEAVVKSHDDAYGLTTLASRAGQWSVPRLDILPGKRVRMQIKARDVMIALRKPEDMSALNVIPAVVAEIGPSDGPGVEIKLDCGGEALVARLTRYSVERLSLRTGTPVFAIVKSVSFDRSALGAA